MDCATKGKDGELQFFQNEDIIALIMTNMKQIIFVVTDCIQMGMLTKVPDNSFEPYDH